MVKPFIRTTRPGMMFAGAAEPGVNVVPLFTVGGATLWPDVVL